MLYNHIASVNDPFMTKSSIITINFYQNWQYKLLYTIGSLLAHATVVVLLDFFAHLAKAYLANVFENNGILCL